MNADESATHHQPQVRPLGEAGTDLICALTLPDSRISAKDFVITPDSQPSYDIESSGPAAPARRHSGQFSKTVCGMDAAVEPTGTY